MKIQLEFSFEKPFDSLKEVIINSVHQSTLSIKALAAALDHAPSNLSRRLALIKSEDGPCLTVDDFERILEQTGDYLPIYYLIDKFLKKDQDQLLRDFQDFKKHISEAKKFIARVEGNK
jgi:hypothetical protein